MLDVSAGSLALNSIISKAIWAPSGDNAQPWHITLVSNHAFKLSLNAFKVDTYNLIPIPNWIAVGMFLENAVLAAQREGYRLSYEIGADDIHVEIEPSQIFKSDLYEQIEKRSVNRFPYKRTQLREMDKLPLEDQIDDHIKLHWFDRFDEHYVIARLMMRSTDIRLRVPETYAIHKDLIEWADKNSESKLPISSVGLSKVSAKMMRWVLAKEERNAALMRKPGATFFTQLELDLLPALCCSSHFIMAFDPQQIPNPQKHDYIEAGRSMQRFWLRLTKQNMALQPWYITFMFSLYVQRGIQFTENMQAAEKLKESFETKILQPNDISLEHVFFTGRIGHPKKVSKHRSIRKPLEAFIK